MLNYLFVYLNEKRGEWGRLSELGERFKHILLRGILFSVGVRTLYFESKNFINLRLSTGES